MRNKVLSALLIVVCILSFTGCTVSGKYINTRDGSSYVELEAGSTEKKGWGYVYNFYMKGRKISNGWLSYSNGTGTVRMQNINYVIKSSEMSINKSKKTITYMGYTYKKK